MTESKASSPEIDKDQLYGEFQREQQWRGKLTRKLAHKAVDIPEDDPVNISVRHGFGWKEILAVGTLALGGWSAWLFSNLPVPPTPTVAPPPVVDRDTTRRIDIEKYIPPPRER